MQKTMTVGRKCPKPIALSERSDRCRKLQGLHAAQLTRVVAFCILHSAFCIQLHFLFAPCVGSTVAPGWGVCRTRSVGDDLTSAVDNRASQSSMPRDSSRLT